MLTVEEGVGHQPAGVEVLGAVLEQGAAGGGDGAVEVGLDR